MAEIAVRPARVSDLPRLSAIYVEMVAFHRALDSRYADEATARNEAKDFFNGWLHNPRAAVLAAETGGSVVGFALGALQKPHLAVAPVRTGRFDLLAVQEAYRRQGVGTLLANALLAWFRTQGAERVYVSHATANPAAGAFWSRLGFVDFSLTRSLELPSDSGANEVH